MKFKSLLILPLLTASLQAASVNDLESSEREFRQLESEVEFTGSKVDTPQYAAMPFPNPSGAALDQLVEDLGIETFYNAFVDETTLTGGVNELVEALYTRMVGTQSGEVAAAQSVLNRSQNAFDNAQIDFNNAQTSLNNQIAYWEGFTGIDYETEFDPENEDHTILETFLGIPTAQVTLTDSQTALDTTQDWLDADQADFDAESASNTLIQNEQANYQAAAAALIAQIASLPALATDPTAFPDFSFFGDQGYILNTPRGFSVYGAPIAFTPDSDQDGLNDGAELLTYLTDPFDADSDDDGISDGDEVNTYSTDPLLEDTSGDGLKDGVVVNAGFDPTVDYGNLANPFRQGMTDLRAGSTMIAVENGEAILSMELEKSDDLEIWTSGGTTNLQIPLDNDTDTKFFRLKMSE